MLTFTDELFEQFAQQHASELLHGQSDVKLWRQIVVKVVYECALREHVRYPVQATARLRGLILSVYFEPVEPTAAKAVFMTASEIHAKLKMWGNITTPMPLNKFGELLKRKGYEKHCLCDGKKGYIVKQVENQEDMRYKNIMEILKTDSTDSTDSIF